MTFSMTRMKFRCNSMESATQEPFEVRLSQSGQQDRVELTWPRTYRFSAQYDPSIPEDQRYAKYTPIGEIKVQVDNPNVVFTPGREYYLDFTLVEQVEPLTG